MSELYELPEGWEWKALDEFTTIKSGKRVPKGYKLSDELTPYPYIRVTDFNNHGSVDTSDIRYISEEIYQKIKNYIITDKDIYISIAGTIGKTGIIPSELNGANLTENAVKIVFDNELYDKRFLLNFTNSIVFMEQVGLATKVVAMPKLAITRLKKVLIPLPPLQEQKRIVAKLDTLFQKIDKAIALHQKNMDEADAFMGSVLNDVFGELDKKYKKKELKDIVSKLGDGLHGTPKYDEAGEYYFINGANVKNNKIVVNQNTKKVNENEYKRYKKELNNRTIFISINGTLGNIGLYNNEKCILGKSACYFNLLDNINKIYITYVLQNKDFQNYIRENATGATIKNVSLKTMREYKVILPPLNIQQKTVAYLDKISQKIEKIKAVQKEKMQSLKALKASILDQAFRGKL
ncbi:restriction endonuclease subunit S [Sulfurimonas sp. SWIR-19]|uniref:restriction endonuclease subunit S n=1 Tax=Sulfurimonas sp. SWIR-19 TaxID=2878390 RepID=UPI001CF5A6F2|nr:restriction endonuclease subunit S [Sulfurimonas sp. SWIR-19]UCN00925.1 restriction endonuclease subunit S [Sulfurimonas sp. SWIR-19]